MDTNLVIGILGIALSLGTFFIGRVTAAKNSGQADGEMRADIKYIKTSVDKHDKKLDVFSTNYAELKVELEQVKGRVDAIEQRIKLLHEE
jgi:peptidoglycan hydrolase CwlO-like protein